MRDLIGSPLCQGKHCEACRRHGPAGDSFRAQIATTFKVPLNWPECHKGIPMGVPEPSRGLGDTVKKTIDAVSKALTGKTPKPCGPCKKRQAAMNKLVPYRSGDQY